MRAGETLTLAASFDPADTSVQEATYKSTNPRIATVDEKGVVTGVKAGRVSIVATAADGSNVRGKINLTVVQPVTGVSYKTPHIRVGAAYNGTFTATLQPANATNKKMTWEVDDPSIATVTGDTNRMRIRGQKWGQTKVTGTTEDGGYQVSIVVDIGSLRHAVRITELKIRDGKPRITLKNNSNLNITQVRYQINGYDAQGNPIQMSRKQDMLMGTYEEALAPGGYSQHGMFNFIHKINYPALYSYEMCITGWTTDTGYNNSQGDLLYTYNVSQQNYEWIPNT